MTMTVILLIVNERKKDKTAYRICHLSVNFESSKTLKCEILFKVYRIKKYINVFVVFLYYIYVFN